MQAEGPMSWQRISIESSRGVASLTLSRAERGNAYDDVMLAELVAAFGKLGSDDTVRIVVIRAAGKHFCVGADIGAHRQRQQAPDAPHGPDLVDMLTTLDALPKPTIALLQGGCIGGGVALVACCDIALAQEDAFFSIPEVRLGLTPTSLLPIFLRAIDYRAFRRYGLSGERFSAAEAQRMGLVHALCRAETREAALAEITEALLLGAPGAIAALKKSAARHAGPPASREALRALEREFPGALRSPEAVEGVASFLEKRKPNWYPK